MSTFHSLHQLPDGAIRSVGVMRDTGHPEYELPHFERRTHNGIFVDHYGTEFPYVATRVQ